MLKTDSCFVTEVVFKDGCSLYEDNEGNYWAINSDFVEIVGNIYKNKETTVKGVENDS